MNKEADTMLEKMFTTKMSMDKKKLQNRFSKIRSKNGKTSKFIAMAVFAVIIVSIICVSIWVAVNRQDDTAVNSDIKLTFNGEIIRFQNEPYILPTGFKNQTMVYFPLEELCQKLGAECEINVNKAIIKIPSAYDNYEIEVSKNEIFYNPTGEGNTGRRETKFGPEIKNYTIYIPYEYVEYIWIDANEYDIFGSTLYKNEAMNIKFEIPMYWLGKYYVDETLEDDGHIVFKHTAIAEKYENTGALCTVYKELDATLEQTLNMLGNQTVVWQNQDYAYIVGRPTDIQHPIWADRDKEDIDLAAEYERMATGITHIESTFSLINDVDVPVITNAENLSYAQMRDLQRQVDNGHFPWRLDYEQVMQSYISGQGENVEGGSLISFAGDDEKCSGTYEVGNYRYLIELFRPIDKTEHGIWIVRSYEKIEPAAIKEISFYNINPKDNTLNGEIKKQEDGWYQLPSVVSSFINFNGAIPESVTAYFTPAGTDMKKFEKQVGYAEPPFPQIPISIKLTFSKEDTRGHLLFVFKYEDGTSVISELFNILVEN